MGRSVTSGDDDLGVQKCAKVLIEPGSMTAKPLEPPFQLGEQVWLQPSTPVAGISRKFHRPWAGPFTVMQRLPNHDYRMKSAKMKKET